jgi:hypothetical protein
MQPVIRTARQSRAWNVLTEKGLRHELARGTSGCSQALFSADENYRYLLVRRWARGGLTCTFGMLNPSTATAGTDDQTIRRCERFARRWGCTALVVWNLFGWRATSPLDLQSAADPVGAYNDQIISAVSKPGWLVVAAWGVNGALNDRDAEVTEMLTSRGVDLMCLQTTAGGHPRHPSRCPAGLKPRPYRHGAR